MNADQIANAPAESLLLDHALPDYRFTRLEAVAIAAAPRTVYQAARELDLLSIRSPLFDLVVQVRALPDRMRRHPAPASPSLRLADLFDDASGTGDQPWLALGENPGREMAFGSIGKVWKPAIEWRKAEPDEFTGFDEPGWAKIAAALVVHPYGERTLLTYEARTVGTDPTSTARFGRYWALVSPGVGVVLRGTLAAVRTAAETRPHRE